MNRGQYFDPWGNNYIVRIDGDYNNQLTNAYTADTGAGAGTLRRSDCLVIVGSRIRLRAQNFGASDDVISWQ